MSDKSDRSISSEKLVLEIRPGIGALAKKYGANIKIVEDPPGPPVRATVLAEIYGPDYDTTSRPLPAGFRGLFSSTKGVST